MMGQAGLMTLIKKVSSSQDNGRERNTITAFTAVPDPLTENLVHTGLPYVSVSAITWWSRVTLAFTFVPGRALKHPLTEHKPLALLDRQRHSLGNPRELAETETPSVTQWTLSMMQGHSRQGNPEAEKTAGGKTASLRCPIPRQAQRHAGSQLTPPRSRDVGLEVNRSTFTAPDGPEHRGEGQLRGQHSYKGLVRRLAVALPEGEEWGE
ncbi:hypothetical protein F7725_027885 [Dissostichus mawsoni]|uniref:Uncharacterized protein n=1 Tax=Dissostichus mawsoni TaxID=36200 RepID=A0A7J5XFH1_DISMA|nr:hypothetical protein F7725_027885 [Dissostichus mawsoni]